jgi:integrase
MSIRKRTWTNARGETKEAWVVDYSLNGKRHIETFEKKKDAAERHARIRVDIKRGLHVAPSRSITVAEAGEDWLRASAGLEPGTIKNRREALRLHINPLIGNVKLCDLTVPAVKHFRDELLKDRSDHTQRRVVSFLGSLIADAMQSGNIGHNPVRELGRRKRGKRHEKKLEVGVDIPLPDDVRSLIVRQTNLKCRTFIMVSAFTGLRNSEVRGLRWRDVDLTKNELRVRQRADRWSNIGAVKTDKSRRTVPFGKVVANSLKEWKLACPRFESDLVFPSEIGRPMYRESIAAQVKYQGFHKLRHFYASWLINRPEDGGLGLPPKVVQERLGHATLAMTMDTYGHLFPVQVDTEQLNAAELRVISSSPSA